MAAGVPPDKVYPIDIDKAFASYDKIKGDVVKWWETGAVPAQMLTDKEVVPTRCGTAAWPRFRRRACQRRSAGRRAC